MGRRNKMGETVIIGRTSKKWFFSALLASLILIGGIFLTVGINGVVYAAGIGGIGKFNVSFSEMSGKNFKLFGELYGDPSKGADHVVPVFVNDIEEVEIKNLVISKNVALPLLGKYEIKISAGNKGTPVQIKGLIQKAALVSGDAQFTEMNISENYVTSDDTNAVSKAFTQGSKTVKITNGNIETHYLFQNAVSLPNLKVEFIKK